MIPALAVLLVLATDAPGNYGATLAEPAHRPVPSAAAAPQDTVTRVPGSALRLGWLHERASMLGSFKQQEASGDVTTRQGDVRWFGTTSQATLTYRGGRLAVVRIECAKPTPALLAYVPDDLRRAGYRCVSHVIESGNDRSEWTGPARIALSASKNTLVAEVTARVSEAAPMAAGTAAPADSGSANSATTADSGLRNSATTANPLASEPAPGALPGELDFTATRADSLPAPRIVSTPPPPVRPRIAIDAGLFGRVQVRARVDTTGHVVHAEILRGIAEFNSAALAWVANVRFEPYRVNGRLAPVVVVIPVVFSHTDTGRANP